jgi:hypothetical protein
VAGQGCVFLLGELMVTVREDDSQDAQFILINLFHLTLSLLMSHIYGAPSKATNLTSCACVYIYIYMDEIFLLRILLLEPCISLIYA